MKPRNMLSFKWFTANDTWVIHRSVSCPMVIVCARICKVMNDVSMKLWNYLVGRGWDDEKLAPWIVRILPRCWFMVIHEASDQIVATAMGLHSYTDEHPFGGELGWVASDSAHRGKRLGLCCIGCCYRKAY